MTSISWGLYLILAAINVLAFVFVRYCLGEHNPESAAARACRTETDQYSFFFPVETKGKTLEEMAELFGIEEKHAGGDPQDERLAERRELLREETEDDFADEV